MTDSRLRLWTVFGRAVLTVAALRIRSHRMRCSVLWIRRTVKARLRLGTAGARRLRARLRAGTALPVHHSEWTIHPAELRCHLQRARPVEISTLGSAALRRTRTRMAGTAIILRHPMMPGIARLPRPAALCERGHAPLVAMRELRIGLMSAAIKSAALVRTAGLALRRISALRIPGCD